MSTPLDNHEFSYLLAEALPWWFGELPDHIHELIIDELFEQYKELSSTRNQYFLDNAAIVLEKYEPL